MLANSDFFGVSLADVGDMNGDSNADLAVGASLNNDGGTDLGAVYVLFLQWSGQVVSFLKVSKVQGAFTGQPVT